MRCCKKQTIITKESIFFIKGLPAVDDEGIAGTDWSQVGDEDLNSCASQILNIQRDIEQSKYSNFYFKLKMRKKCVIFLSYLQAWLKILIVEKIIPNDISYS